MTPLESTDTPAPVREIANMARHIFPVKSRAPFFLGMDFDARTISITLPYAAAPRCLDPDEAAVLGAALLDLTAAKHLICENLQADFIRLTRGFPWWKSRRNFFLGVDFRAGRVEIRFDLAGSRYSVTTEEAVMLGIALLESANMMSD